MTHSPDHAERGDVDFAEIARVIFEASRDRFMRPEQCYAAVDALSAAGYLCDPAAALRGRDAVVEALTPSADTKAAYIGEFAFNIVDRDEDGDEVYRNVRVPWDTIKEIMAAILARAALHDAKEAGE